MKQKEARKLHIKNLKEHTKILKDSQPFVDTLYKLERKIVNNPTIRYKDRDSIGYYVPLIVDLYLTYNYGKNAADRLANWSIRKRRRYKKHKYA